MSVADMAHSQMRSCNEQIKLKYFFYLSTNNRLEERTNERTNERINDYDYQDDDCDVVSRCY